MQGDGAAAENLAYCFDVGIGVPRDPDESRRWYLRAIHLGNSGAILNLAISFRESGNAAAERRWLDKGVALHEDLVVVEAAKQGVLRRWSTTRFARILPELRRVIRTNAYEAEEATHWLELAMEAGLISSKALPLKKGGGSK